MNLCKGIAFYDDGGKLILQIGKQENSSKEFKVESGMFVVGGQAKKSGESSKGKAKALYKFDFKILTI